MSKFFFIPLIIATMVCTPSYASYYKFALSYEKARHEETRKAQRLAEEEMERLKKEADDQRKEQIRIYKRYYCQKDRVCRQNPPQAPESQQ